MKNRYDKDAVLSARSIGVNEDPALTGITGFSRNLMCQLNL